MNLFDGDIITCIFINPPPHELATDDKTYLIYTDKIYIYTPQARRDLARGYIINWLERWVIIEARIIFRKLQNLILL